MDNCPASNSSCPNHQGTHSGHTTIDVGYYTFKTNRTQVGGLSDIEVTEIWSGESLLTDIFDWERNYIFMSYMYRAFPGSYIIVHQTILNHMVAMILAKYSDDESSEFQRHVSGDNIPQYQHNKHCHIKMDR